MHNKQKLWRRAANSIKRQMIAKGEHEDGVRYGRAARNIGMTKFVAAPSILFQNLCLRVGLVYNQGEPA